MSTIPVRSTPHMTLASVRKGRLQVPLRILVYGVEGVGKSSFAARAPNSIFLGAEGGTGHLDVARLPEPESWSDVLDGTRLLARETHNYQTYVIDPINWLEGMLFCHVCEKAGWADIETPGYGKGYVAAAEAWRELLVELERLWIDKRMHIVLVGHAAVKLFKNPEGEDYERYQVALHEKIAGPTKQWCDMVLFAKHEAFAKTKKGSPRARGVSTGARLLYTTWSAAYDAKNRHNLPEELPLSWRELEQAIRDGEQRVVEVRARIEAAVAEIGLDDVTAKARAYMDAAGDDLLALVEIENAAMFKLDEVRRERVAAAH
jgi:hypothetical protein